MSIEADIVAVVGPLCGARFYPDFAPANVARPYVTYSQVGGVSVNPLNGSAPHMELARIQFNVWADSRIASSELMRQIETALRVNPLAGQPVGALIARSEEPLSLYGAQQDFAFWWHPVT